MRNKSTHAIIILHKIILSCQFMQIEQSLINLSTWNYISLISKKRNRKKTKNKKNRSTKTRNKTMLVFLQPIYPDNSHFFPLVFHQERQQYEAYLRNNEASRDKILTDRKLGSKLQETGVNSLRCSTGNSSEQLSLEWNGTN